MRCVQIGTATLFLIAATVSPTLAAPPANDDRGNAKVVGGLPYQDNIDTSEATPQGADPECDSGPNNPTVWYSFTPAQSGRYGASTAGSDYDTTLFVGTPDNGGLEAIGCNDDSGSLASAVAWQAQAGTEYLIMVGACCGSEGGQLRFRIRRNPPNPGVEIRIAATARINKFGAAIIRGHTTCRNPGNVSGFVDVSVRQVAGRFFINGDGGTNLRCNRGWRVRAKGNIGIFKPGKVAVRATAFACGNFDCDLDQARRKIRLRAN